MAGWRSRMWTSVSGQKMTNAVAPAMAIATNSSARNRTTSTLTSVLGGARRARVGDRVADVGQAAGVDHEPLEAQAETGVRHGAVAAEIAVPAVVRRVEAELRHPRVEHVQPLLALRTADDLADARRQHVHRGDGPAVVVQAHVERLDVLR